MLYAMNDKGQKVEPARQGEEATDPYTGKKVEAQTYTKPSYWRLTKGGYDSWCLPVCAWSLRWKQAFPKENVEIVVEKA